MINKKPLSRAERLCFEVNAPREEVISGERASSRDEDQRDEVKQGESHSRHKKIEGDQCHSIAPGGLARWRAVLFRRGCPGRVCRAALLRGSRLNGCYLHGLCSLSFGRGTFPCPRYPAAEARGLAMRHRAVPRALRAP